MPNDTFNPWNSIDEPADTLPKLDINTREGRLSTIDFPGDGSGIRAIEVAKGTLIALDFGSIQVCVELIQPGNYRCHCAPLGSPLPQVPDNEPWTSSTRIQAWVDGGGGLRVLRVRGKIHLRRFATLFQVFRYRPEAQAGQIPIYVYKGFEEISTKYGMNFGILLEFKEFIDRDDSLFGPRITPPPLPILAGAAQAPRLPAASTDPSQAPPAAASLPAPPAAIYEPGADYDADEIPFDPSPSPAPSPFNRSVPAQASPPSSAQASSPSTPAEPQSAFRPFRPVQPTGTPGAASTSPALPKKAAGGRKPY